MIIPFLYTFIDDENLMRYYVTGVGGGGNFKVKWYRKYKSLWIKLVNHNHSLFIVFGNFQENKNKKMFTWVESMNNSLLSNCAMDGRLDGSFNNKDLIISH